MVLVDTMHIIWLYGNPRPSGRLYYKDLFDTSHTSHIVIIINKQRKMAA